MSDATVRVVIPARMQSSRLPGKVLADLGGEPVLAHVVRAAQASKLGEVWVASDATAVLDTAARLGVPSQKTSSDHPSGSDRIHEVAKLNGWADDDVIVNLQGDEPFMPPALLQSVAKLLMEDERADWATVASPIHDSAEFANPACVKVVCDQSGNALYFSRAPIPHERDAKEGTQPPANALRHIGLYAYRVGSLARYCENNPTPLEELEKLEQLRALECGMRIKVFIGQEPPPPGIDTVEDLESARQHLTRSEN